MTLRAGSVQTLKPCLRSQYLPQSQMLRVLSSAASTRPKKICRLDTRPRAPDSPPSRQRRIRQRWSIAWFRSARAWPALREALAWEAPSCFDADLGTPTRGVGSASGAQTRPRRRCSRRGPSSVQCHADRGWAEHGTGFCVRCALARQISPRRTAAPASTRGVHQHAGRRSCDACLAKSGKDWRSPETFGDCRESRAGPSLTNVQQHSTG